MSSFETLLTNPYIIFVIVIICTFFLYLLVNYVSFFKKNWKCIEILGLLLANVGILISICNNRISISEREMNKAEIEILHVESYIKSMIPIYLYDVKFNTGLYEREVLDLAEEDYLQAGMWIKKYKDSFIASIRMRKFYNTEISSPPIFKVEKDIPQLKEHIKILNEYIPKYNSALKRYNFYMEGKDKTYLEILIEFIAPLFIAISLSINILSLLIKPFNKIKNNLNELLKF